MTTVSDPSTLTLQAVADQCGRQVEPSCFELFRRAIAEADQRAWFCLHAQYHRLVGYWVRQHPRLAHCEEDADYFVNAAFARMARSITPAKFGDYQHVGQVVKFLKRCAFTAILDHLRQQPPPEMEIRPMDIGLPDPGSPDETASWRRCVEPRLKNDQERLVAYGSYMLGVKPGDFLETWPGRFQSAAEVYQIKANLVERLRRDESLRRCLENA